MGQDLLPRWPPPPHRCSPRGPPWPRMAATIAPPPTQCHLVLRGFALLPTEQPAPEGATGDEAPGACQGGGTGVTVSCSETLGVHQDDGSGRGTDMKSDAHVKSWMMAWVLVVVVAAGTCVAP